LPAITPGPGLTLLAYLNYTPRTPCRSTESRFTIAGPGVWPGCRLDGAAEWSSRYPRGAETYHPCRQRPPREAILCSVFMPAEHAESFLMWCVPPGSSQPNVVLWASDANAEPSASFARAGGGSLSQGADAAEDSEGRGRAAEARTQPPGSTSLSPASSAAHDKVRQIHGVRGLPRLLCARRKAAARLDRSGFRPRRPRARRARADVRWHADDRWHLLAPARQGLLQVAAC